MDILKLPAECGAISRLQIQPSGSILSVAHFSISPQSLEMEFSFGCQESTRLLCVKPRKCAAGNDLECSFKLLLVVGPSGDSKP